ncbi:TIGR01777 family oxidoreductase [Fulvivirga maritima]|uniref:TIGR01777 family oxidoreductase n=1 Tax=Fulvivirga maritima TaxID=2904247 RepID=UPI001F47F1D0|nr:TIGR01777 family oxidoreductase [Fulvivirga maritima]UII28475.1 TIGR01777 family oxidoreductase [Fulvivirga maritima]
MSGTVLITGGTGLIGGRLTELLQQKNYTVKYLSRNPKKVKNIEAYAWDVNAHTIDEACLQGTDYIINLAGAGIADERWNKERKKILLESRTRSTALLKDLLRDHEHQVKAVVSASAIGYYGYDSGGVMKREESRFGDDFLATVTKAWEAEADLIADLGIKVSKIRVGLVLTPKGGALEKLMIPAKFGLNAPLGSGDQYMSWIHIDDLCHQFIYAMENQLIGPYNGVAPNPVTNKEFTKTTSSVLHKPAFLPPVPAFMLKLILGEMASMLLGGSRVSSEKIEEKGFQFQYPQLRSALEDLIG